MIIITCVDEKGGMLFHNRRQSKDRNLLKHIMEVIGKNKLWISEFSSNLFEEYLEDNVYIVDDGLYCVTANDYCFVENLSLKGIEDKIDKIILYNWNRHYPADTYWELPLDDWHMISEKDIVGSSHEKITERIYIRSNG